MDLVNQRYYFYESEVGSPMRAPPSSLFGSALHSSHNSFPIIAVAVIGILATGFLLVSYYIFVIKCCLNWHRIDLLRRFSFSRRRHDQDPLIIYSPQVENRGLDEAVIRSIPIFQYKKTGGKDEFGERSFCECAVCLTEFKDEEKLRRIPNCGHVFHIDCIDVWLQNNANCPLCRTSISATTGFLLDQVIARSPAFQGPSSYSDSFTGRDEDYVIIEIEQSHTNHSLFRVQERLNSGELSAQPNSPSPRKSEPKITQKKTKKFSHVSSMGDECIDTRQKDGEFAIQPLRRSFSMDSATDRQLYLAIQEIIQKHRPFAATDVSPSEVSRIKVKRSFFSFGHERGSRNAVLPVHLEP